MVRLMVGGSVCFALLACLVGCPGGTEIDRPDTAPVSGTVTYNGSPVDGASVSFSPDSKGGYASIGVTDSAGSFKLQSQWGAAGAVPGNYKVAISKSKVSPSEEVEAAEPVADEDTVEATAPGLLPAKYQSGATSEFTAEVKAEGENNFTFELTD